MLEKREFKEKYLDSSSRFTLQLSILKLEIFPPIPPSEISCKLVMNEIEKENIPLNSTNTITLLIGGEEEIQFIVIQKKGEGEMGDLGGEVVGSVTINTRDFGSRLEAITEQYLTLFDDPHDDLFDGQMGVHDTDPPRLLISFLYSPNKNKRTPSPAGMERDSLGSTPGRHTVEYRETGIVEEGSEQGEGGTAYEVHKEETRTFLHKTDHPGGEGRDNIAQYNSSEYNIQANKNNQDLVDSLSRQVEQLTASNTQLISELSREREQQIKILKERKEKEYSQQMEIKEQREHIQDLEEAIQEVNREKDQILQFNQEESRLRDLELHKMTDIFTARITHLEGIIRDKETQILNILHNGEEEKDKNKQIMGELEARLDDLCGAINLFGNRRKEMEGRIGECNARIGELEGEGRSREEVIAHLEGEKVKGEGELSKLTLNLQNLQIDNQEYMEDKKHLETAALLWGEEKEKLEGRNKDLEYKIEVLEGEAESREKEVGRLGGLIEVGNTQNNKLTGIVNTFTTQNEDLIRSKNQAQGEYMGKIAELEGELVVSGNTNAELEVRISELTGEIEVLRGKLKLLEGGVFGEIMEKFNIEMDNVKEENKRIKEWNKEVEKKRREVEIEVREKEDELVRVRTEQQKGREKNGQLMESLRESGKSIIGLQGEIEVISTQLLHGKGRETLNESLCDQLNDLTRKYSQLAREHDKLNSLYQQLLADFNNTIKQIQTLEYKISEQTIHIKKTEKNLDNKHSELTEKHELLSSQSKEFVYVHEESEKKSRLIEELEGQCKKQSSKFENLLAKTQDTQQKVEEIRNHSKKKEVVLANKLKDLERDGSGKGGKIVELEGMLNAEINNTGLFRIEIEKLRGHNSWLERELEEKTRELLEMKKKLVSWEEYKREGDDQVDELMAYHMNEAECPIKLTRVAEGQYMFGTKKIFAKVQNDRLVIRVGGGYMRIDEFLSVYTAQELAKLKRENEYYNYPDPHYSSLDSDFNKGPTKSSILYI